MARYQGRKERLKKRKKKKSELGSDSRKTKMAEEGESKNVRGLGGSGKTVAMNVKFANVSVKGKTKKVAITSVGDNPSDKDFRRENVLALGGEIETEMGKAKITSRPGQDGVVNAVLID